jgi:hypothetical protein
MFFLFSFLSSFTRPNGNNGGENKIQRDTELITVMNETVGNNYRFVLTHNVTTEPIGI